MFKVGDKVKVKPGAGCARDGQVYYVFTIGNDGYSGVSYKLSSTDSIDGYCPHCIYEPDSLELVSPPTPKFKRNIPEWF